MSKKIFNPRIETVKINIDELNSKIIVAMSRLGICASDPRMLRNDKVNTIKSGTILGHEGGGRVINPNNDSIWKTGEKVVVLPHKVDGICSFCLKGHTNLCPQMEHLGFDLNGVFGQFIMVPRECVKIVGSDFPDDALPLIEPLACVIHAWQRLAPICASSDIFIRSIIIFGGGPIGCLHSLFLHRKFPAVHVSIVEPIEERRSVIKKLEIADEVTAQPPTDQEWDVAVVASSALEANLNAMAVAKCLLLFSGINTSDIGDEESDIKELAEDLEKIHRKEGVTKKTVENINEASILLVGSSGYTLTEIDASCRELTGLYRHYCPVQNVIIDGIDSKKARYLYQSHVETFDRSAIEVFLSPMGIHDPQYGSHIARALKVLIRV